LEKKLGGKQMVENESVSGMERVLVKALCSVVLQAVKNSYGGFDRHNCSSAIDSLNVVKEWISKGDPKTKGLLVRQRDIIERLQAVFGEGMQAESSVGIVLAIDAAVSYLEGLKQKYETGCCGGRNCQTDQAIGGTVHEHGGKGGCGCESETAIVTRIR
jgi:hypothetical protein